MRAFIHIRVCAIFLSNEVLPSNVTRCYMWVSGVSMKDVSADMPMLPTPPPHNHFRRLGVIFAKPES